MLWLWRHDAPARAAHRAEYERWLRNRRINRAFGRLAEELANFRPVAVGASDKLDALAYSLRGLARHGRGQ